MGNIQYTTKQIRELSKNEYVEKVSEKYISFTKECKILFIQKQKTWMFYRDIFKTFKFPEYIVNSKLPERCSQRWQRTFKEHGFLWFTQSKWRPKIERKDTSKMTLEEENEYLRAEVAYLKEIHKLSWKYP